MIHNFALADLRAALAAFCLYPPFVVAPGYIAAWLLDLFRFRRRTLAFRLALSIPLSISLSPILIYLVGRFLSMTAVWGLFAAFSLGFAATAVADWRERRKEPIPWAAVMLAGGWTVLAILSLVGLQLGNRLYYSSIAFDYSVRSAIVHSLATRGIPAQNPFFFPGHPVSLRYHYFWLIVCSMVERMGRGSISAQQALLAGTPWCGMGLMGLVALYLRLFSTRGQQLRQRRTVIGMALLGVTGLDILPTLLLLGLYSARLLGLVYPSLEWWNLQVDGWIYTMLWEPHHLAGFIACLTGFLLLWQAPEEAGRRGVLKNGLLAGIAFGTAVGASIHVFFVFAIFLAVWGSITIWKRWRQDTAALLLAGATSTLLALPYLTGLLGPGSGGPPLEWKIRSFPLVDFVLRACGLARWQVAMADLALLPLNYLLELGFFLAVGWLRWRAWRRKGSAALDRRALAAGAMLAVSVITCTFLRSSVIGNNDLGWRGFLIAQFVLLLWAADLLAEWPFVARRQVLAALLFLGAAGTLYDVISLRIYPVLADAGAVPTLNWMDPDRQLGRRTYAVREAYEWADRNTPATAVLQHNPDVPLQDTAAGLYADRQAVAFDMRCVATFGGDPRECTPIASMLQELYSATASPASFEHVCTTLPIDMLVVKDLDPAWRIPGSWVWTRRPVFANEYVRMFRCRQHL